MVRIWVFAPVYFRDTREIGIANFLLGQKKPRHVEKFRQYRLTDAGERALRRKNIGKT